MNEQRQYKKERDERGSRFLKHYTAVQPQLYGFVSTLVFNWSDVEDVIQETSSIMWSKFDEFEEGTDFAAWAIRIAKYRILNLVRSRKRKLFLSEPAMEAIAGEMLLSSDNEDHRLDALRRCVSRLPEKDRKILGLRYERGATAKGVADKLGQNVNTFYKNLSRIHFWLFRCVNRTIVEDI